MKLTCTSIHLLENGLYAAQFNGTPLDVPEPGQLGMTGDYTPRVSLFFKTKPDYEIGEKYTVEMAPVSYMRPVA